MKQPTKMKFTRFDYAAFAAFFVYAAGSVVIPVVLVIMARDLGFSLEKGGMTAGGALHLGRTVPMVASMLLCGFLAATFGKRLTIGWSTVLMSLGMGLCAVTPSYGIVFVALLLAGAGEGIIEGLSTPFVQDIHKKEPGRYINFSHSFWSVGVLATVLLSGYLLSAGVSWRIIIGAVSVLTLTSALMFLLPSRKGKEYPEHKEAISWKSVLKKAAAITKLPRFWLFFSAMFVAGGGEFCITFWSASYIQLNLTPAAWAGGVGTAFFAGGMVLGRTGWGYLIKQHRLKALVLISALAGTAITMFFPVVVNLWLFFFLLFLAGVATAPFWPSLQSVCADCHPKEDSTMIFVLLACAGVPGCGFFTWLMGYMGNHGGLAHAFYLVPGCYLVLSVLVGYDWYVNRANE
jgi:MFS family permease